MSVMNEAAPFRDLIKIAPQIYNSNAAAQLTEKLGERFETLPAKARDLVRGVASCSPYLRRLIEKNPERLLAILAAAPNAWLASCASKLEKASADQDRATFMAELRCAKDSAALAIALADIGGVFDEMQAALAMSDFADAAVQSALRFAGAAKASDATTPGLAVLAMGKHGAKELNYSSDIDLYVVFDPDRMAAPNPIDAQETAVRITKEMISLLQTQTSGGYVFRTDLRLRPDPGVSAVAISVRAAETYYEAFGQNWERMAFIKARPIAGDIAVAEDFLTSLRPFIWRKFLDFAAIEDVQAVKRQIHSAKGGSAIEFAGHDVKVGRGGIREVEFFVQTQQLILGGKKKELRGRSSLAMLQKLRELGHVSLEQEQDLDEAYRFLRKLEHRIQMINDEQTHSIPKAEDEIARLASFMGYGDGSALEHATVTRLEVVRQRYDALFSDNQESNNEEQLGPLVFTGVDNDPATVETLRGLGFQRPEVVCSHFRSWHAGGIRATRVERARLLLTKLMPPLLAAFSTSSDPDDAFIAFAEFARQLPAGVQIFSLLANNEHVINDLIEIMTISPYLGKEMARRTHLAERLVEGGISSPPPLINEYDGDLKATLPADVEFEDGMNIVRRWAGERRFLIAAQLSLGIITPDDAAAHFTAIADACICALMPIASKEIEKQHGKLEGELIIVGLGRLGAGEMTATSDIDVVFVYDDGGAETQTSGPIISDGPKPLSRTEYFTRLVRRIVTALSAQTQEGGLFEVDMQLRPSGGAGPAAVSFAAFERYYREDAWTWEHMALTRARVIASISQSENRLAEKFNESVTALLCMPRERSAVSADVDAMRDKLADAKPAKSKWDLKVVRGGLTDISFISQFLALVSATKYGRFPVSSSEMIAVLSDVGALSEQDTGTLMTANERFEAVMQIARATVGGVFDPDNVGEALKRRIALIFEEKRFEAVEAALTQYQSQIVHIYQRILEAGDS